MNRTARNLSLFLLAGGLIALLLVLGPNLDRVELAPGTTRIAPSETVRTGAPSLGTKSIGARGMQILMQILFVAALVCLVIITIGSFFNRNLRRYLVFLIVIFLVVSGAYYLLRPGAERATIEPQSIDASPLEWMEGSSAPSEDVGEMPPPGWSFTAMAILLAIGAAVLFAIVWAKFAPRWRRRETDEEPTELEELVETLGAAADEIELGSDPRVAVLRCYREMVRILCRNRPIDHLHMTARELADALHRAGFTIEHVDRLTEIFELVRYGNRSGVPLAERALGCLNAIREAYAT